MNGSFFEFIRIPAVCKLRMSAILHADQYSSLVVMK